MDHPHMVGHTDRRKRFSSWLIALAIVVAGLIVAFPLLRSGVLIGMQARRLRDVAERAYGDVQQAHLADAEREVTTAAVILPEVRASLRETGFWQYMPVVGTHIRALEQMTDASEATLASVQDVLHAAVLLQEAVQSALASSRALDPHVSSTRSFADLSPDEKRTILLQLSDVLPELKVAREKMTIALDQWDALNTQSLASPIQQLLRPLVNTLHQYQTVLDQGITLCETFLPLSGISGPKTYLVLLQNADEMRPTGGFIGTVGLVTLDAGEVKQLAFQDVYTLDNAVQNQWHDVPPDVLQKQLGVKAWFFRDSNWSPDFPQSASRLLDTFAREQHLVTSSTTPIDGIIALEPNVFERLLTFTGPLSVAGETFHAGNFFDQLEYDVEQGFAKDGMPVRQRKEIVSQVGDVLVAALIHQPASRWPELMAIIVHALQQKDIILYATAPQTQQIWDAYGWTDRTRTAPQDYLWVVDANLAGLKTDGVMDKQISYHLDAQDPTQTIATVTLNYRNTNRVPSWRYTRYRDYVRVYVPEGSQLISSSGAMANDKAHTAGVVVSGAVDVMHDLGKTVFGAFWAIEPGESRSLSFTYRLPPGMLVSAQGADQYDLLLQRQPGNRSQLTLDLNFGKKVETATPAETSEHFGDARYQMSESFEEDQLVHVRLAP